MMSSWHDGRWHQEAVAGCRMRTAHSETCMMAACGDGAALALVPSMSCLLAQAALPLPACRAVRATPRVSACLAGLPPPRRAAV
jgi:hypothetical protein